MVLGDRGRRVCLQDSCEVGGSLPLPELLLPPPGAALWAPILPDTRGLSGAC